MIKMALGIEEKGIQVGNTFDKYHSKNMIVNAIMRGFTNSLDELVSLANPTSLHEVGCGEGYWVLKWLKKGLIARGSDFSSQVIKLAMTNAQNAGLNPNLFKAKSIYDLMPPADHADLVVCCEVMEHLDDPIAGLKALQGVVGSHLLISVPREPIWCFLNMARGKYWKDFGNTPGHVQHWSKKQFIDLVGKYFDVIAIRNPLPWTMLLCEPKKQN
jgi:2-polyprenyl-3-methyl-5-hydroxy-6-metoxy-1,4-benzoquinol methylase